jgi:hypothetical protein
MVLFLYNNKPLILVAGHGGYAIATVAFCSLLIRGYSAAGAAAGTGLAEFLFIGLLVSSVAAREITVSAWRYLGVCYLIACVGFSMSWLIAWTVETVLQASSLVGLIAVGTIWAVAMALPTLFLALTRTERIWLFAQGRSGASRAVLMVRGWR